MQQALIPSILYLPALRKPLNDEPHSYNFLIYWDLSAPHRARRWPKLCF